MSILTVVIIFVIAGIGTGLHINSGFIFAQVHPVLNLQVYTPQFMVLYIGGLEKSHGRAHAMIASSVGGLTFRAGVA
jgi:hypothetical protein